MQLWIYSIKNIEFNFDIFKSISAGWLDAAQFMKQNEWIKNKRRKFPS